MTDTIADAVTADPGGTTPAQTVGPFLALVLPWADGPDVVADGFPGAITLVGRVTDGAGAAVPDALIETWQADADGRFAHPDDPRGPSHRGFRGFGRCPADPDGTFRIRTVKPGPLPSEDGTEAPHIDVSIFARGLLHRYVTRVYFPGEPLNELDPVLLSMPVAERALLVARAEGADTIRFDICLQGDSETPFFDL